MLLRAAAHVVLDMRRHEEFKTSRSYPQRTMTRPRQVLDK